MACVDNISVDLCFGRFEWVLRFKYGCLFDTKIPNRDEFNDIYLAHNQQFMLDYSQT